MAVELPWIGERKFGKCSLFDLEVQDANKLPFQLPVKSYLDEVLHGVHGASRNGRNGQETAGSKSWGHLERILGTAAAHGVCTRLAWLSCSVLFTVVSEGACSDLRRQLAEDWFLLLEQCKKAGPAGHERERERELVTDALLDALPPVFVQAIYRLLVDGFPPEVAALTKHAAAALEKIGMVVLHELFGLRPAATSLLERRRKLFRKAVLDRPHLNVLESRKAEMRQQQLEGRMNVKLPLEFGRQDASKALDDTQLEHVTEHLKNSKGGVDCAASMFLDRYNDITRKGEELFGEHMGQMYADAVDSSSESEGEPAVVSPKSAAGRRGGRLFHLDKSPHDAVAEKQERRRREKLLVTRLTAPLPPHLAGSQPVTLGGVSPLLERKAPGACGPQAGPGRQIKISPPAPRSDQFLPKLPGALPRASKNTASAPELTTMRMSSTMCVPQTRTGPSSVSEGGSVQHAEAMARVEQNMEAFRKTTFDQYKKQFDVMTGQRQRVYLDGTRLKKEEDSYVRKIEDLVGNHSTPALKLLGVQPSVHDLRTIRRKPSHSMASLDRVPEAAVMKLTAADSGQVSQEPSPSGGRKPWALTSLSRQTTSTLSDCHSDRSKLLSDRPRVTGR